MKMRLEVKKGVSKALLAALMVFCVLAGSEGIGKGAEVLAAAVRPDSLDPGEVFDVGNSGDPTVYEKGVTVYVKTDKTCSFVAVKDK